MNNSLHLKSFERGRFRVTKFPNRTAKFIHQMCDEMVTMIVIEKDNKTETNFEVAQTYVEGSFLVRAPKKQKRAVTIEEKKEKTINNLVMKKYPKGFDETKCKHVNESIRNEFSDCFPLGNKPIEGIKVHVDKFLSLPRRIMYHPLSNTHKNEIKHRILMFHYIDQFCPIFAIPINPNSSTKILETKPKTWFNLSSSMFFIMGGQHTIQAIKVNCILQFLVVGSLPIILLVLLNSFELIHFLLP